MSIKRSFKLNGFCAFYLSGAVMAATLLSGCTTDNADTSDAKNKTGEHDDHHKDEPHPETFGEAVDAVVEMNAEIKAAFAKDDKEAAHDPLHEVGHVLEEMDELAAKAELSDEQLASVKKAVEQLFESFGAVDAVMHGKEGKTYDEVSSQIDESLNVLKSMKPAESKG